MRISPALPRLRRHVMALLAGCVALGAIGAGSAALAEDAVIPAHELTRSGGGCKIRLLPKQSHGDTVPVLLVTWGGRSKADQFAINVETPFVWAGLDFVHSNRRDAFEPVAMARARDVVRSPLWRTFKTLHEAQKPFHLTARTRDGKFVSARYEGLDPQGIIAILENQCDFASARVSAKTPEQLLSEERALGLSDDQVRHIRWVLLRRFSTRDFGERTGPLSTTQRDYLQRFATERGQPPTRYLNRVLADMLLREPFVPHRNDYSRQASYRVDRDWLTYRTRSNARCVMLSHATRWSGADLFSAPRMQFQADRGDGGSSMYLAMVTPNPFNTARPVSARVDGRSYRLEFSEGEVKPPRTRDGFLSNDVMRALKRGRGVEIIGTDKHSGRPLSIWFSAYGFTSAFDRMMRECNRYGLRVWIQ